MVTIRCEDRPKLLFDTVCTLTDRDYVIFRWNVDTQGPEAHHVSNFHCFRLLFILTSVMLIRCFWVCGVGILYHTYRRVSF